ncbi:hypothetical protein DWB77_00206 [Streptomyces hundungensis]|uniref:Uncharacterized protein n=1 Tax=Streptomyces hundungensis TaxID=1077946 RepID=A0A387H4H4_9ACTN|nr:hypothetical protein [Streptomyces hundungensis]AYG78099.1 hypothetical protein DWB77_00206 [Streptomyces hundungensis]
MVQVDAFWAYAIGAGCALAGAEQLRLATGDTIRQRAVRAGRLTAVLLFMGLLFTPMGMWLAIRFPGWETMYTAQELPPWGLALFSAGITASTALGYLCVHRLLRDDRVWAASLQLLGAYVGVFIVLLHGWDGSGLHRFLAPAPQPSFSSEPTPGAHELMTWLRSSIASSLLLMALVFLPALLWLNAWAHTGDVRDRSAPWAPGVRLPGLRGVRRMVVIILGPCLVLAVAAHLAVTECGVLFGGLLWSAAAGLTLHPRGPLAGHCRRIVLPSVHGPRCADALSPPPAPVATAAPRAATRP